MSKNFHSARSMKLTPKNKFIFNNRKERKLTQSGLIPGFFLREYLFTFATESNSFSKANHEYYVLFLFIFLKLNKIIL